MRLTPFCLLLLASCASGGAARQPGEPVSRPPVAATSLLDALRDSTSPSRVYLPREVARPAESVNDVERAVLGVRAGVEPTVVVAAVRGVVDTSGNVQRSTLTLLPGSDPREGSILMQRAATEQWRPARLADGRAVRQLVEWRVCRAGGSTCTSYARDSLDRTVPRVRME